MKDKKESLHLYNSIRNKDSNKVFLQYDMRDINGVSRGNALALNRRNSLPCTVRNLQRSYNKRVGCLQILLNGLALVCYQPSPEV